MLFFPLHIPLFHSRSGWKARNSETHDTHTHKRIHRVREREAKSVSFQLSERMILYICLGPRTVRAPLFGERARAHQPRCLAWARHAAPPGWEPLRPPPELICTFMSKFEDGFSFCWNVLWGSTIHPLCCPLFAQRQQCFVPAGSRAGACTHASVFTPSKWKEKKNN